ISRALPEFCKTTYHEDGIPTFEGGDPRGWILKAKKYFRYYHTPDEQKVEVASMYLEGDALDLFAWITGRSSPKELLGSTIGQKVFLNGLKEDLKADVRIHKPRTVYKAVSLALEFEAKLGATHGQWLQSRTWEAERQSRRDKEAEEEYVEVQDNDHQQEDESAEITFHAILRQTTEVFLEVTKLPQVRSHSHAITLLLTATPPNIRPYRYPYSQKTKIDNQVQTLLSSGFIRPNSRPFASPVLLVKKKDNSWRLCVDYRKSNQLTVPHKYPIPNIDELLDELHRATVFSKINLKSGYHQIHLEKIQAVMEWPIPRNVKELRGFLG
ncbi:hypothetical protein Tco_0698100, partial [Tanacetum coccineum]